MDARIKSAHDDWPLCQGGRNNRAAATERRTVATP